MKYFGCKLKHKVNHYVKIKPKSNKGTYYFIIKPYNIKYKDRIISALLEAFKLNKVEYQCEVNHTQMNYYLEVKGDLNTIIKLLDSFIPSAYVRDKK